ncbi:MAG: hypothetical protein DKM50_03370 [Candidatus Margulisiibacteriota bacterium]|nr:MAG: hypothetical protein A2X43_09510 [Candidatus Margulisbacteria bacterium GWD2_39_127]OGI02874.1 MAG: hypothetical protein A2X42_02255 [Candidatus Margulisbacteria bacterium GWF2_38_17]OGI09655.1 MAG: hypothetical protein A2X41_04965 [Candidatus Margulisbacteria bacterium GWE2_39_32]PZM83019.1 MAG: hypothetical protein DKM50_03370 [Candidatus Margulisiibacteriota bacterium]HAR62179.1 hypothetical protein [Candidatus Margulisiibacteriota bacterium]
MTGTYKEEFRVKSEQLVQKIKMLIQEGNVRKIIVKGKEGNIIMSLPLTIGVIGAVIAPMLAAIGAAAALIGECTIAVERHNGKEE